MNKKLVYTIGTIVLAFIGILLISISSSDKKVVSVTTYEECAAAGYPILATYPPQCQTPEGTIFTYIVSTSTPATGTTNGTKNTGTGNAAGLVIVDNITANALIESPIEITGHAPGGFFFEGSFPVKLLDSKGKVIGEAPAKVAGDWMTDKPVPFSVTLSYIEPTVASTGTLVFHNDNPSGLPQNDKELRISVRLTPSVTTSFNNPFEISIGEKANFSDTLTVTLSKIDDSRCKSGVKCIWAGELSPVFIVGKARSVVRLGTVSNTSVTFGNYTFILRDATATTATIVVKKNV
ncbi:MAG: Gmad2 immunoglobulin-like domain-containing protein [Patescibacteria group bacterium]